MFHQSDSVYSLNRLPSNFRHDRTLPTKVFIAEAKEVVDDKSCKEIL